MVETSCHIMQFIVKYLLVVIEKIDRSDDCYTKGNVSYNDLCTYSMLQNLRTD